MDATTIQPVATATPEAVAAETTTARTKELHSLIPGAELLRKRNAPAAVQPAAKEATAAGEGGTPTEEAAKSPASEATGEEAGKSGEESSDLNKTGEVIEQEEKEEHKEQAPEWVQKRIDKLTAQRRDAEEKATAAETKAAEAEQKHLAAQSRITELETALQAKPQPIPQGTAADPLAGIESAQQLTAKVQEALELKRWAIRHPEGGIIKGDDGKEIEVTSEQAREALALADDVLTVHAPRKHEYLKELSKNSAIAREVYPDIFDSSKPDGRHAAEMLRLVPQLKNFADYHLVVGHYLAGKKACEEREAAAKKPPVVTPAEKPVLAPSVPRRTAAPLQSPQSGARRSRSDLVKAGGSVSALTAHLKRSST